MSLKQFDDTILDDDDEYETPKGLYDSLCEMYDINPKLDVCATILNRKCYDYISKEVNALREPWCSDVWCNPPHSKTDEFVKKAQREWERNNINILMIIPANSVCAYYFGQITDSNIEIHPVFGRPRFLRNGRTSKFPSRNSYFVVVWRKK